jgi:Caspase domain
MSQRRGASAVAGVALLGAAGLLLSGCAAQPKDVKSADQVVICAEGKCGPAEGRYSREQLVGGLLLMIRNNENAETTLCEADPATHKCAHDALQFFVQGGPVPGIASIDAPYITQVGLDKASLQIKYRGSAAVRWMGTPVFCQDQYTEVTVKSLNEIFIEAPSFACTWTAFPMVWHLKFAVSYIDFDHSIVAGNYSTGGAGLMVVGGGEGSFAMSFPKTAEAMAKTGTNVAAVTSVEQLPSQVLLAPVPKAEEVAKSDSSGAIDPADRKEWDAATADGSPAAYRRYLQRYPQGRFAAPAKAHLDAVAEATAQATELNDWDAIKTSTNPAAFDGYVAKYPKGLFAELAAIRARRLRAVAADSQSQDGELAFWDQVRGSSSVEELQSYLNRYPNGQFAGTARERIASLSASERDASSWNRIKDSRDPDDYRKYLASFPNGQYAGVANARVTSLVAASRESEELTAWDRARNSSDPAQVDAFVARYPNSQLAGLAKQMADQMRANARDRQEMDLWDKARASGDVASVDRYLASFPAGRFVDAAKELRVTAEQKDVLKGIDFGTYHALVIGINRYPNIGQNLVTAINDARSMGQLLHDVYGFDVKVLENPDRKQIIEEMTRLRRTLTEHDNLLVYYAGHGYLDNDSDRGYWLPSDADRDSPANWISTADITDTVKAMHARHVMIVADSCYSGTLARDVKLGVRSADYLQRIATKRARTALTSGGIEPVVDGGGGGHSVFAGTLLQILTANKGVLEGAQLFTELRRPVATNAPQTPEYAAIRFAGDDGGDFLFIPAAARGGR